MRKELQANVVQIHTHLSDCGWLSDGHNKSSSTTSSLKELYTEII